MEKVACNNCASKKTSIFYDKVTVWEHEGEFTLVKCLRCDLVFVNPRPLKRNIHVYYPAESYWGDNLLLTDSQKNSKKERNYNYGFLYKLIFKHKKKGTILDIGAGTGLFLSEFAEKKWDVSGVELSKQAVGFARKAHKLTLKQGDLLDTSFKPKSFDIVTLNNVLEHVYDPKKTLEAISMYLKDDGAVVITVPNIESLGSHIFKKNWYALQVPRHLYHFSPETLTNLLHETGFVVEKIDHGYRLHNYFTLYESCRRLLSPRFKKQNGGGLANPNYSQKKSFIKEVGKKVDHVFATILSELGSIIQRGEVITVYAIKKT